MNFNFRLFSHKDYLSIYQAKTIFQTKEWLDIYSHDSAYQPFICALVDEKDEIVALQSITIQKVLPLGKWGRLAVAWGLPLNVSVPKDIWEECCKSLLMEVNNYCRKHSCVLEYRHIPVDDMCANIFKSIGFRPIAWCNILNNYVDHGYLVDNMVSQRSLKTIQKNIENGFEVNHNPSKESWSKFHSILKVLYKKIRRPLPNLETFEYCLEESPVAHCMTIEKDGEVYAGAVVLVHEEEEAYLWYETVNKAMVDNKNAGLHVCYAALCIGMEHRVKVFNFLGAGPKGMPYGVRDFKLKFGGTLVDEYRFRKYYFY